MKDYADKNWLRVRPCGMEILAWVAFTAFCLFITTAPFVLGHGVCE